MLTSGSAESATGMVDIRSGNSFHGTSGNIHLEAGSGADSVSSGYVELMAGDNINSAGGEIIAKAGKGAKGGSLYLGAGDGNSESGGSVQVQGGHNKAADTKGGIISLFSGNSEHQTSA